MRPFLSVLSLSNHCTTEGLVLIKGGVYLMLCIGINSAATSFVYSSQCFCQAGIIIAALFSVS